MTDDATTTAILGASGLGGGDLTFSQLYVAIKIKKNKVKKHLQFLLNASRVSLTGSFFTGTWHKL